MTERQEGFTLLEVLIGLGILAVVSTAIYFSYANVIEIVQASQYNSASLTIIESQVELVRNMRYEDVGTVGGVPAGKIPQTQQVTLDGVPYTLESYVRNIDDPFDGTLGGTPNDTAPADYKLVQFQVTCPTCTRYRVVSMTTYVAPKNLESSSENGNLFIQVLDAFGQPVQGATVHVTNSGVTPAIDLTDVTGANGMLQLVDTATSSAEYHITVAKSGYSSDQTYPPGNPANPVQPDATVATQQLTITTLAIDRVSTVNVAARDAFCAPAPGMDLLMTGTKLIGTLPDVPKYSQAHTTGANGILNLAAVEWDTYTLKPTDTAWDVAGVLATSSLVRTIDPNTTHTIAWQVASRSGNGLLISVVDAGGTLQDDATVRVTGPGGYDRTAVTGRASVTHTDWTGAFADTSGGLDVGTELLLADNGGQYATGSYEWLISETINLGSSSVIFGDLSWNPESQPGPAGTDSVRFQVAANNDDATWSFVGPDGTPASYFTSPGDIPASLDGNRYFRYRVELKTDDEDTTPSVTDITLTFRSGCTISGQAYFNGLGTGTYTVTTAKSGYSQSTVPASVTDSWQRQQVTLSP